ncbi:hypothetical protein BOW19_11455, partial [Solemya velum gill symbiont]|uniref:hypothetical protein n=6 Tax=Solemya velum gill symbiont TaxID=2340 RepID=UPI0009C4CC75
QDIRMYGTRSNQQDAANTEYGELLREISAKLSELISKFDGLGGAISDITTVSENQKVTLKHFLDKTVNTIQMLTSEPVQPNGKILFETDEQGIEREALQMKKSMSKLWARSLNERKQAFWNMYRNDKISKIYLNWTQKEKPILPKKFIIKEIEGECKKETEIRANFALNRLNTEILLLDARKIRYEDTYNSIDEAMIAEIVEKTQGKGDLQDKLCEIWLQDTKREEMKTATLWERKQTWFENYEKSYGNDSTQKSKPRGKLMKRHTDERAAAQTTNGDCSFYSFSSDSQTDPKTYAQVLGMDTPVNTRRKNERPTRTSYEPDRNWRTVHNRRKKPNYNNNNAVQRSKLPTRYQTNRPQRYNNNTVRGDRTNQVFLGCGRNKSTLGANRQYY